MSERVTVYVDEDEWFPVWSARQAEPDKPTPYGDALEVDRETADRWVRVFREFDEVQSEIKAAATRLEDR